ncbi:MULTISPECIES: PhzF family phenazine biosynthesis protein [unclassified Photorhabdus]|uniref:PhzF family phenazine biosynthesis protein n=1 Tax=unclassified Photorhabdus TaxID=2620880 RepID=UPI000DCF5E5E|nr:MULTISPECIES: PhzF family phenazine biosynthesis protein [unclassified Photorhabdus]RAX03591.1 phenazine biosynthesis protein PhzF [Photorhabdus sp. S9-53]RAX03904.1 phenazine biosynthesis protein PhzF [Photorhabdus sp. S10-54]RAX05941.1 phenazine biosynthesis protein PhzF [Photorhabdus sp. S8-52]
MSLVPFKQVDVFTHRPFKGNPVAVVMDAKGLTPIQMQAIANWTNLSETTFVLPVENPLADYHVRIFTPGSELPFAGHPTIGTAHALLEAGLIQAREGRIVQECGAGLITLNITEMESGHKSITFELPEPAITLLSAEQIDRLESILGCPLDRALTPALIDVGARWIVAHTTGAEAVLAAEPDYAKLCEHDTQMNITGVCLYGAYREGTEADIEVRSFAPSCGVNEDPVCGSGNGSVAAFMRHHKVAMIDDKIVHSSQGKKLGRQGSIWLSHSDGKIFVGGGAVTCINGTITI